MGRTKAQGSRARPARAAQGGKPSGPSRGSGALPDLRDAVVILDAEDIALAHLQKQLRRSEAIQVSSRPAAAGLARTTLRLSEPLLARAHARAKREGETLSALVARALERFLRTG